MLSLLNTKGLRGFALAGTVAFVSGILLTGCGKEEAKPSAPGYYDGPMQGKGAAKSATEDTKKEGTP